MSLRSAYLRRIQLHLPRPPPPTTASGGGPFHRSGWPIWAGTAGPFGPEYAEGRAVVGHQRERHPAGLDRLGEEARQALGLQARQSPDADQEATEIVDQSEEVSPLRAAARPLEVEGALEIDVPELVHGLALVARTRCAPPGRAVAAAGKQAIELAVAHRPDPAPAELRLDALAVCSST